MKYLEGLNNIQKEAILADSGPVLIVAGAGAGKTKTLTTRIAHLIHTGVSPRNILAVTFTNKAAKEMTERVSHMLSDETQQPLIKTFHSFGVWLLRRHSELLGRAKSFTILDESDAVSMIKDAMKAEGLDPKQYDPKMVKSIISREKGNFENPESFEVRAESAFEITTALVWKRYERILHTESSYDFDDLLVKSVVLLRDHADIRAHYQKQFKHILIDEYQDTNTVQYELVKFLVGEEKNICVVGDTDQNIYSWRGAEMRYMLRFEKDFPGTRIFLLEENYRSTKTILAAANAVIKKNNERIDKTLFTNGPDGEHIVLMPCMTERDEAEAVATHIIELQDKGIAFQDIAILYRNNFLSRNIEEALLGMKIPYQVLGTKFFDRKEVRDILAYLRASQNNKSQYDIKRTINTPARGIGKVTLDKLFSEQKDSIPGNTQEKINEYFRLLEKIRLYTETHSVKESIVFVLEISGLKKVYESEGEEGEDRLANVYELATLGERYTTDSSESPLLTFLDETSLLGDQDSMKDGDSGVRLMTVHAAKGLEFKYVFIIGLEEGLFPYTHTDTKRGSDKEEERRLFYVALTRAKTKLYLSYAQVRMQYGMREIKIPSSFIHDIPEEHILAEEQFQSYLNPSPKERIIYID